MRIVFMGTPEFAAAVLRGLSDTGEHEVAAVVTRPDTAKGRSKRLAPPPVKELAVERGIPVLQPRKLKDPEFSAELEAFGADVFVVAAYGRILPEAILNIPPKGCVNVHGSLLPKYRGAAPIQRAVIDGAGVTGVTIMMMDAGIDTGGMILKAETEIAEMDTYGTLRDRLAAMGAEALAVALRQIEAGTAVITPQNDAEATYAAMITPDIERVDWREPSRDILNLIRGLNPEPGAYTTLGSHTLKLWEAEAYEIKVAEPAEAGTVAAVTKRGFAVATGRGVLLVTKVQPQGGKIMAAGDYLRGHALVVGMRFE